MVKSAQDDQVTFLAASIAFYAVLSIFPLLLLALALGSYFVGEAFAQRIVGGVSDFLTPQAQGVLEEAMEGEEGRSGASIVGIFFLLWSSLRLFRGLDIAFSEIYTQHPTPSFLDTVKNALIVLVSIGAAVVALVVIQGYLQLVTLPEIVHTLSPVLVFVTLVIVFFPMYYVFPGSRQRPRAVLPGVAFAAAGWTLLGELFGIYAANAGTYALFGLIGAILLLLVWFYFGAVIVLLGAIVNAVLAGKYRLEQPAGKSLDPGKEQ